MKKLIRFIIILSLLLGGIGAYFYYNIRIKSITYFEEDFRYLYIKSTDDYNNVMASLEGGGIVGNTKLFDQVAQLKSYPDLIKSGKYKIENGLSAEALVNKLRSGDQVPVKLTFNNVRLKTELAGKIAQQLELDSLSVLNSLNDNSYMSKYGLKSSNSMVLFIPNTYEVWWDMSKEELFDRMAKEFKSFWNEERKAKARKIGLSQTEVTILASIVESEQRKLVAEWPKISGLYLNRLRKGMKLQSDPTVIYGIGDFSINRVLRKDLLHPSPYNTYMHKGLPPGIIRLPDSRAIDAVLNAENHRYLYMCAKGDGSYEHRFAISYSEHLRNASNYQAELNKSKIYR